MRELKIFKNDMANNQVRSEDKIEIYIAEVNKTLKKVALYRDYKELYKKVVPCVEEVQEQM